MMKWMGILCIFGSCGYACFQQLMRSRSERRTRQEILSALRRMKHEIMERQTTVPRIAELLSANDHGPTEAVFSLFLRELNDGVLPIQAWTRAMKQLPLPEEEKMLISTLGRCISAEETTVVKEIDLIVNELEKRCQIAERNRVEEEKRASVLWFSAAAMLVILLI